MVSKGFENAGRTLIVAGMLAVLVASGVEADDTEIFQFTPPSTTDRPQVLIVFDDSNSMNDRIIGKQPYDPNETGYTYDGFNKHPGNRVYWSTGTLPPFANSNSYFLDTSNRCASAVVPLENNGFFSTRAVQWSADGLDQFCVKDSNGLETCYPVPGISPGWNNLVLRASAPPHVECEADVINSNPLNPGHSDGFPQNTSTDGAEYGAPLDTSLSWGGPYVFFSAHYMDWYHDTSVLTTLPTKLEVAQQVVAGLVETNPDVDFGLALFNDNEVGDIAGEHNGGRIVQRLIANMDAEERSNLTTIINGTIGTGTTPLCESTLEVYRYLAGEPVVYGLSQNPIVDPNDPLPYDLPLEPQPADALAENPPGTYDPPPGACKTTYVILMTDGRPFNDTDANQAIEQLTGKTCGDYLSDHVNDPMRKNCLPVLAEYMATNDLDQDSSNGEQFARTYAIGFGLSQDEPLLNDATFNSGGQYFAADNAEKLIEAFLSVIKDVKKEQVSFASPSAAVDTFSRTRSRNEVFFSMFEPGSRVNWPGNIKRLDVKLDSGDAVLVDAAGNPALDSSGQIRAGVSTFWGNALDGPEVTIGGAGALLKARDPASRVLYSNTGSSEALQSLDADNMTAAAFGYPDDAALYTLFGVGSEAELLAVLDWAVGYDLSDEDQDGATDDARWALADMMHSQPLVVNYGARSGFTTDDPDLRIVVGTNGGFLHMFRNSDGEEAWAFFPKELAPVLNQRRLNADTSEHVYGIDASPVIYTEDRNRDGTIELTADAATSDKVYLYFGLRRGGRGLYALDISDPDAPEFLWRIDNTMAGFAELGQTWSNPVVTRIPGYRDDNGLPKPVLVFGAGYDPAKDSPGLAVADAIGRGIFIVDAATGELVWSMTPAVDSATNMQEVDLLHSVAAGVTVLDSNGDELTDRIYFASTGGRLWRVDLPGDALPDDTQTTWRAVQLAQFNGGTAATDRRFFNAPDLVRTRYSGAAFDAILIGSGDRTNPNDMDDPDDPTMPAVDNQFYMIRDLATKPYFTTAPSSEDCNAEPPSVDFRCDLPVTPADLYDVTANAIQDGTSQEQADAQAALADADTYGWRLDLVAEGEKSLSRSITIGGAVYFSTYAPSAVAANVCEPATGTARLYGVNLLTAAAERDFDDDGELERFWDTNVIVIPDTPAPHFGSDGEIRLLLPTGTSGGSISSPMQTGTSIPRPHGSYWYREEY